MARNYAKEWRALSYAQSDTMNLLEFAVPIHQTMLRMKWGVLLRTLKALERRGYARVTYYHECYPDGTKSSCGAPFWTLTQSGQSLMRNYRR